MLTISLAYLGDCYTVTYDSETLDIVEVRWYTDPHHAVVVDFETLDEPLKDKILLAVAC